MCSGTVQFWTLFKVLLICSSAQLARERLPGPANFSCDQFEGDTFLPSEGMFTYCIDLSQLAEIQGLVGMTSKTYSWYTIGCLPESRLQLSQLDLPLLRAHRQTS